ncbi:hypothetical protein T07_5093 [Trichinella nelsoni]|uniref:Uncharacterized protein n=1 Tax=Trichinella nelsoni TaxID=6336 RepID=A0A0V0RXY4_9BILA|nr:hypothetical protein T07_5093 [Trichinella nelsoni]
MHILPETPPGYAELASVRSKRNRNLQLLHSFLIAINYVSRSNRELPNHCRTCETLAQVMQVICKFLFALRHSLGRRLRDGLQKISKFSKNCLRHSPGRSLRAIKICILPPGD